MRIVLNLLAARQGGQVTRAIEFISRFHGYTSVEDQLIVLSNTKLKDRFTKGNRVLVIGIKPFLGEGWFARVLWENANQLLVIWKLKPDVYLTFSHYLPILGLRVPSVVAVSNLAPFSSRALERESFFGKMRLNVLRRTILSSARRASIVISPSRMCKEILHSSGVPESRIRVVPNGVIKPEMRDSKKSFQKKDSSNVNKRYVLSVSNFYRYKNFEQLINAFGMLSASIREIYTLKLVGNFSDTGYVASLRQLVEKLGLRKEVEFIPEVERRNLGDIYRKADLFVFPSLIENCPNILLEALAYGAPILCINEPPMPEFGSDAVGYFSYGDVLGLADKMKTVLLSSSIKADLSQRAIRQAKYYDWDIFSEDVVQLCYSANQDTGRNFSGL